jgi:hypothetical protein
VDRVDGKKLFRRPGRVTRDLGVGGNEGFAEQQADLRVAHDEAEEAAIGLLGAVEA